MADLSTMLANKRILAIDDLVESRSAMKKMLTILGAERVDVAMDGDEATELIVNNDYGLVISDYNLGRGRDGQQILEEARFTHQIKSTCTFVMLTGENAMDMVMGAIEYEPDDYITKPFTIDVMRQRLTRILSIKAMFTSINEALDNQDRPAVLALCEQLLVAQPRLKLRIERIKGRTLIKLNQYQEALDLYENILQEREINWALLGKATCLFKLEKYAETAKVLTYTIEQHPKYVQCYDLLSKVHIKNKDLKSAQNTLVSATRVSPKQVLRQMELGRLAYANKDFSVAEAAFKMSVKLARHSCYRSVKNYLFFAKSLQHKITPQNTRDSKSGSTEAFKAVEEAKTLYKDNADYVFEATIIESTTYSNLGKETDAKDVAAKAEELLTHINEPSGAMQLSMVNVFLDTKQHAKAQDLLAELSKRKDLSRAETRELTRTRNEISEQVVREYTTEINDKAIGFFERGQLQQAIDLFNQATAYKEAGYTVIVNAIQAKVTFMDQREPTLEMVKEVEDLLLRLGELPETDERYNRWQQLKKSLARLKRMV
jgi:DNA-binding response OmpR family regulator